MKKRILINILLSMFLLLSISMPASASPCNDGAGTADSDLWSVHNCWWDFVLWQYKAYRMWDGNWRNWGFRDACNAGEPYPKSHNASYLLTYGLTEGNWQWHGTLDYRRAGEAWSSPNHNTIHYVPANTRSWLAQAQKRFWSEDRTRLSCLLFDIGAVTANPATRAGDYVHEGWHHWQYKRNYSGHMSGPIGSCTMSGSSCDWYYWHGVGAYAFGEMHKYTSDGRFFHSPNQAQVEFLCDVSEMSKWWVPASVRNRGRTEANQRLANRFRNAVGYRCGDPRPW